MEEKKEERVVENTVLEVQDGTIGHVALEINQTKKEEENEDG